MVHSIRALVIPDNQVRAVEIPVADFTNEVVVATVFEFAFDVFLGFLDDRDDVVVVELVAPSGEDDGLGGAWDAEVERVPVMGAGADNGAVHRTIINWSMQVVRDMMKYTLALFERLLAPGRSSRQLCSRENRHYLL